MINSELRGQILQMADGNPGAATVLAALWELRAWGTIKKLHSLGIRRPAIWVIFKDCCDGSAQTMIGLVERCPDKLLIEASQSEDRSFFWNLKEYL